MLSGRSGRNRFPVVRGEAESRNARIRASVVSTPSVNSADTEQFDPLDVDCPAFLNCLKTA